MSLQSSIDCKWMRKAITAAENGYGTTSPNPMVGAVIVKDDVCIGIGYHVRAGEPHAEINAIHSMKSISMAKNAVIYVTLEPCSSWGRTPPCCNVLIECGFSRVVIGSIDPNPRHAGRAVKILEEQGISVTVGVEKKKCDELNRHFFKWIQTGTPYVLLKMAETLDGKSACENGISQWITSQKQRERVHRIRLLSDAILIGAKTFMLDHPSLTARNREGQILRIPRRFVASNHPEQLNLPDDSWTVVSLNNKADWTSFLERLGHDNVVLLLIEGGGELAASAISLGMVDEVEFHIAPKILGGRNSRSAVAGENPLDLSGAWNLEQLQMKKLGCDIMIRGRVRK